MSPIAKCHGDEEAQAQKEIINGTRPSPLKISRDSHLICKKTWSSSSMVLQDIELDNLDQQQQQQHVESKTKTPIIIYTHSPKVIHTQPRDFMALVQKLTGMSRPKNPESNASLSQSSSSSSVPWEKSNDNIRDRPRLVGVTSDHDNESSSVVTNDDETCLKYSVDVHVGMNPSSGKDLFPSSSLPIHLYSDSSSLGFASSVSSPSGFDFFKGLSDY